MSLAQAQAAKPPHIVFILADDMGYGDPGCYNPGSKIPTPQIDRLAREGLRFTDAHAPGSWCVPSRYGLMTGRYPFRRPLNWRREPCIAPDRLTLPSMLKQQGYHTVMSGKWHLGFVHGAWDQPLTGGPIDRGFDEFFGIPHSTDIQPYYYIEGDRVVQPPTRDIAANNSPGWSPIQGAFWREGKISPDLELIDVLPDLTDRAVQTIQRHHQEKNAKPLFLYLAFPAPHTPWLPTPEFVGSSGADLYGDFMVMVDSMVGRVLTALDLAGMTQDTLVIFSSDNGPVWYDEDIQRLGHDSQGPLRGMKGDAWEAGHRVPFVARWPGRIPAGETTGQLLCFTDMMATFAAITGASLPEGAAEDSVNLLPIFLGQRAENDPIRQSLVVMPSARALTVRSGPWKLIPQLGSAGFSQPRQEAPQPGGPTAQLYHLANDLGERHNLFLDHPGIVREINMLAASLRVRLPTQTPDQEPHDEDNKHD